MTKNEEISDIRKENNRLVCQLITYKTQIDLKDQKISELQDKVKELLAK